MSKGALYAAGAYVLWGLLPLFWKALQSVPALEILAHRVVWSLAFVALLLAWQRKWRWLPAALRNGRVMAVYGVSSLLLSANWLIYIWAVNAGRVVEASLGYFIAPLVNVALGVLGLKERLRPWQGVAIAIATAGVLSLTLTYGAFPWIAVSLALTFGLYGLIRKVSALDSLEGLTLETMLVCAPALAFLVMLEAQNSAAFGHAGAVTSLLLIASGVVTALPLLLFAAGARRVPMTLLGVLQYIAPTLQFLLGVLLYREVLDPSRLLGFCLIWTALGLYAWDGIRAGRAGAKLEASA